MKKKVDFIGSDTIQVCDITKGELFATGCALWEESDNCPVLELTGQTIAYHKAMRDLARQEKKVLKKEIADIENLEIFLFPKKLQGKEIDFVKQRFQKYLQSKYSQLNRKEEEIQMWDGRLRDYIQKKKEMRKKIEEKGCQVEDGRTSETKES